MEIVSLPARRRKPQRKRVIRTCARQALVILGGINHDKSHTNRSCWYLHQPKRTPGDRKTRVPELRKFTEVPEECPTEGFAICGTPTGFVVTGGRSRRNGQWHADVMIRMYTAASKAWVELYDLPVPRFNHSARYLKGTLYIMGGQMSRPMSDFGEREQRIMHSRGSTDDNWQNMTFPEQVDVPQVVADIKHNMMWFYNDKHNSFYSMRARRRRWYRHTALPGGAHYPGASMTCSGGVLYVAGGLSPVLAKYTMSTDSWEIGVPPYYPHVAGTLIDAGNKLYLVGGYTTSVEEYDKRKGIWEVAHFKVPERLILMASARVDIWGQRRVQQRQIDAHPPTADARRSTQLEACAGRTVHLLRSMMRRLQPRMTAT